MILSTKIINLYFSIAGAVRVIKDCKYRHTIILKDGTVCVYSREELTSRGDSTFLYTSYISRKKFMAEVRNEQIQNHLAETECINSENRQDKTSKNTTPFHAHTKYNTWHFQLIIG